jgi:hypothetical protein
MVNVKILFATAVVLVAFLGLPPAKAQSIQGEAFSQARAFANQSLHNYVTAAVTEANASRLGFKTLGEAQSAHLGEPVPVLLIGLNDLKAFQPGTKIGAMLKDIRTLWFPVLVNGEVRSKLEISEVNGKWLAGEFGRPGTAKSLSGVREDLPKILETVKAPSASSPVLVRIPALHAQLFYESGPGGDFLVPAQAGGLPEGVEVGKAYPAEALLAKFAEMAKRMDANTVD